MRSTPPSCPRVKEHDVYGGDLPIISKRLSLWWRIWCLGSSYGKRRPETGRQEEKRNPGKTRNTFVSQERETFPYMLSHLDRIIMTDILKADFHPLLLADRHKNSVLSPVWNRSNRMGCENFKAKTFRTFFAEMPKVSFAKEKKHATFEDPSSVSSEINDTLFPVDHLPEQTGKNLPPSLP